MRFLLVFWDLSAATVGLVGTAPAALNKLSRAAGANVRRFTNDRPARLVIGKGVAYSELWRAAAALLAPREIAA